MDEDFEQLYEIAQMSFPTGYSLGQFSVDLTNGDTRDAQAFLSLLHDTDLCYSGRMGRFGILDYVVIKCEKFAKQ